MNAASSPRKIQFLAQKGASPHQTLRLTRMRGRGSRQKLVPTGTDTGLTITSGVVALGSTCATKALGQGW